MGGFSVFGGIMVVNSLGFSKWLGSGEPGILGIRDSFPPSFGIMLIRWVYF